VGTRYRLPARLDVESAGRLVDGLMHHVASTDGLVILDCSALERIDPSAVAVLATVVRWVRDLGRECQLDLISDGAQQEIAAWGFDAVLGVDRVVWRDDDHH
jgi:anti-anti-sigma regulatory factor